MSDDVIDRGGARRPTLSALAESVGLSKPTVSRALNDYPDISDSTKQRVREAAASLGYVGSSRARQLTKGHAEAIGMVTLADNIGLRAAYQSEFTNALSLGLAQQNYDLLVHTVLTDADEVESYKRLYGEGKVDGFVIMRTRKNDTRVEALLDANIPFVTQGRTELAHRHAWLDIDVEQCFAEVFEHLYNLGHRHFAFLNGGEDVYSTSLRHAGVVTAALKCNVPLDHICQLSGDFSAASGRLAMRRLRDENPQVTALICSNDAMAMGAVSQANELGLSVPNDISVTGYDGVRLAEFYNPPITTLAHSAAQCGQALASMVVGLVQGDTPTDHQVLLPADLTIRSSTAPVAGFSPTGSFIGRYK